jgi:hypothetical protein
MPKVFLAVFQVGFGQDAKNHIGIFAVFQVDFGQDAKNPRAPWLFCLVHRHNPIVAMVLEAECQNWGRLGQVDTLRANSCVA